MSILEIKNFQKFQLKVSDRVVLKKYQVRGKIGEGQFSSVYSIIMDRQMSNKIRAVKVEHEKVKSPQISTEIAVIKNVFQDDQYAIGFPKIYEYGCEGVYNYMVMKLLGPNIGQLIKLCGGSFSLKTTILIGLQILDRIQKLHHLGYVYQDVKPQNFVVGLGNQSPFIFIIDFGKCMLYRNKKNSSHVPYRQGMPIACDCMFASINIHNSVQYSRRDDLQSMLYLLIYIFKGSLPWSKLQFKNKKDRQDKIAEWKRKITPQSLTRNMPIQITDLIWYIRSINFYQKPDYQFIRTKLYSALGEDIKQYIVYDWNLKDQVDYAIYQGIPKILLYSQDKQQNQKNNYPIFLGQSIDGNSIKQDQKNITTLNKLP